MQRQLLLQSSLPLIPNHGFTRLALAKSVLNIHRNRTADNVTASGPSTAGTSDDASTTSDSSHAELHEKELSDRAIDALFGEGDEARRTLIKAWMAEGRRKMREIINTEQLESSSSPSRGENISRRASVSDLLKTRLKYNEPVLRHLPDAFALMLTPSSKIPIDPRPALWHAALIADEACFLSGSKGSESWYTKRATLAAIYTAAELHQLTSPQTAEPFLEDLLSSSTTVESALNDAGLFAEYFVKSWAGIVGSLGLR